MIRFSLLEGVNKILGFIITALLSRILAEKFGTYLYYQTIFTYLYAVALFSSDYNFLINYKISKTYIGSAPYYQTIFIKILLVSVVLLFSIFVLIPHFTQFAFWPYLISVFASLFVYDFVLYIENDKKQLIIYRLLAQAATFAGVLLFYFKRLDSFYITIIQALQTMILAFGTFWAARKYMPKQFNVRSLIRAARQTTLFDFFENLTYFLLRNFITFFTTIEIVILTKKNMIECRDIFAEGMRLSGILIPFVLFYINFNINKIKQRYYTNITIMALALLLFSPVYVLVFFGKNFAGNIYYYNFFIWVFIFNAFIEKDYIELLTLDNTRKKQLVIFNMAYFFSSVLLFALLYNPAMSLLPVVLLFSLKLLLYYLILIKIFKLQLPYSGVIASFIFIHVMNYLLSYAGYYEFIFRKISQLKNQFI